MCVNKACVCRSSDLFFFLRALKTFFLNSSCCLPPCKKGEEEKQRVSFSSFQTMCFAAESFLCCLLFSMVCYFAHTRAHTCAHVSFIPFLFRTLLSLSLSLCPYCLRLSLLTVLKRSKKKTWKHFPYIVPPLVLKKKKKEHKKKRKTHETFKEKGGNTQSEKHVFIDIIFDQISLYFFSWSSLHCLIVVAFLFFFFSLCAYR